MPETDAPDQAASAEAAIRARVATLEAAVASGTPIDWPAEYRLLHRRCERLTRRLTKVLDIADRYQASAHDLIGRLEQVNEEFRQLRDLGLPVCRYCGKLHGDPGYLERVGPFLHTHPDLGLAQSVCPDCLETRYGHHARVTEPMAAGPRAVPAPVADAALERARAALTTPAQTSDALATTLRDLTERYGRLLRRLNKLVLISDRYQAQLHDSNLRLEHLASTDALTGLSSRQAMRSTLEAEVRRARLERRALTLLALDVDYFKKVNDTYGHEAGDVVLVTVAAVLQRDRRRADSVGRWGGEEFVVLLPDCAHRDALAIAERLRAAIEAQSVSIGERIISVTASIGLAVFTTEDTVDDLLRRADEAMYAAKHAGRNRVVG